MPHGFAPASLDAVSQVIKTRYVDSGAIPGALTLAWRRGEVVHLGLSGFIDLERKTAMRADAGQYCSPLGVEMTAKGASVEADHLPPEREKGL